MPMPQTLESKVRLLEALLESIHHGVAVTDAEGVVLYFNEHYARFLGVDAQAQIGRHCTEVVENSRMHIVARTGVPEINQTQRIRGQEMLTQRIPIRDDSGQVVAVFGQVLFKDVRDMEKLARQLSLLESKVRLYEEEIQSLRATRYTFDSIHGSSDAIHAIKKAQA